MVIDNFLGSSLFVSLLSILLLFSVGSYFLPFDEAHAMTWMKIAKVGGGECWTPAGKDLKTFSDNRIICSPDECPEGEDEKNLPPICGGDNPFPENPPLPCEDSSMEDTVNLADVGSTYVTAIQPFSSKNSLRTNATADSEKNKCINKPPVADAGNDLKGKLPGQTVTLNGNGFDDHTSSGDLKYKWLAPFQLDNPDSPFQSFKVPPLSKNEKEKTLAFTLTVTDEEGLTGSDNVDIKIGCNYEPQRFDSKIWKFDYEVVSQKGLVLKNIMAGNQKVFDSISVPHFKIQDGYNSKIIRYCDSSDPKAEWFSIKPKPITKFDGNDYLHWSFGVKYKNSDELVVNYDIIIGKEPRNDCEANAFSCYRFIPKVSFSYSDLLENFAAFYKLDYGSNVGLSPIHDSDVTLAFIINDLGRHPMLTEEIGFLAVEKGQAGKYDNIHTAHPTQSIKIPGCREGIFDCVHMHWRWSDIEYTKLVDPMVEPSTGGSLVDPTLELPNDARDALEESLRGKPNLVPGQTIAVAIVNYHPEEEDPDDPSILLNNEKIAIAEGVKVPNMNKLGQITYQDQCPKCYLKTGGHPVVWYVTSVDNKDSNTFFRHGIFVLDTLSGKKNVDEKINGDKLH